MRTGKVTQIERRCVSIETVDLREFDLVVALHPDQGTEPALRSALAYGIDFAIVPCCVFPLDGIKRSQTEWLHYLASLAPDIHAGELPITGANVVLWKRSHDERPSARVLGRRPLGRRGDISLTTLLTLLHEEGLTLFLGQERKRPLPRE